jgi:hypothetical protein
MRIAGPTELFESSVHPIYSVRVRGTSYLWGSNGLNADITFDKPLILHIRNDLFGEPIDFGTLTASGTKKDFGTLQPGQCVSIPVQSVVAVFATCSNESVVGCSIKT